MIYVCHLQATIWLQHEADALNSWPADNELKIAHLTVAGAAGSDPVATFGGGGINRTKSHGVANLDQLPFKRGLEGLA